MFLILIRSLVLKNECWRGLFVSSVNCWISETEQVTRHSTILHKCFWSLKNHGLRPVSWVESDERWKKKKMTPEKARWKQFQMGRWTEGKSEAFCMFKANGLCFLAGRVLYLHPCFCFHPFASQVPKFEHGETPSGEVEE